MDPNEAERLAVAALVWIAQDSDRTGAFLGSSGAEADDLRARAADPMFLGFVLDYLMMDDQAVIEFAQGHACPPEDVMRARAGLPGGNLPNWT